ncbi:DoxX family protein [Brachybacterium sp. EF45031]|uniref:DoxX family protein n=1 Tax=Brachybacterium sillae TaxID=2810536 RepID=UPI00217E682F|nr:DoxX family protein [Brachybacterium sillae]MCS6710941.1 DoxX family protein [Brachybacterium sillae]
MSVVRSIARPLLAAPFILEGVRTASDPERVLGVMPQATDQINQQFAASSAPSFLDAHTLVRATGVAAAAAGLMYANGTAPRLASALLLGTTSVGWAGRKRIWELSGEERLQELQSLLSDLGLIGGVLLAVVDHDGRPSLGYRLEKLAEQGRKKAERKQREAERAKAGKKAAKTAKKVRRDATSTSQNLARSARQAVGGGDALSQLLDEISRTLATPRR